MKKKGRQKRKVSYKGRRKAAKIPQLFSTAVQKEKHLEETARRAVKKSTSLVTSQGGRNRRCIKKGASNLGYLIAGFVIRPRTLQCVRLLLAKEGSVDGKSTPRGLWKNGKGKRAEKRKGPMTKKDPIAKELPSLEKIRPLAQ